MKNKTKVPETQRENHNYSFIPLITTVAFPLLIGRQKNGNSIQEKSLKFNKPTSKGQAIAKYEVTDKKH